MKRRCCWLFVAVFGLCMLSSCAKQETQTVREEDTDQTIALTVWGGEEDEALLQKMFTSFQAHYADQAHFQITYQAQSESSCKDALLYRR